MVMQLIMKLFCPFICFTIKSYPKSSDIAVLSVIQTMINSSITLAMMCRIWLDFQNKAYW